MTYQQQIRYWVKQKSNICPQDSMLNDLAMAIREWQDDGDRIILLADMNDDVSGSTIQEFCKSVHLVEAIHYLHGRAFVPTHQ